MEEHSRSLRHAIAVHHTLRDTDRFESFLSKLQPGSAAAETMVSSERLPAWQQNVAKVLKVWSRLRLSLPDIFLVDVGALIPGSIEHFLEKLSKRGLRQHSVLGVLQPQ